jgi:hypothetical protein
VAVNTTIYCFTTEEVTNWWILLGEVVPSAPRETELDLWLRGEGAVPAAGKAAAEFYKQHLQNALGLAPQKPEAFGNYEKGMAIFREAFTTLTAQYKRSFQKKPKAADAPSASARSGG